MSDEQPQKPLPLPSRHRVDVALARSTRHRAALEAALEEAGFGPGHRQVKDSKRYLAELRKELELTKRREADLLGALNVTREEKAWLEEEARTAQEEIQGVRQGPGAEPGNWSPVADRPKPAAERTAPQRKPHLSEHNAIEVRDVRKSFRLPVHKSELLKEQVLNLFRSRETESLNALDSVSFDVGEGEFLGVCGANGSGKSTLLKIIASIYAPDDGTVKVAGRIAPFIELGVGLNPEVAARENVVIGGVMMGLEPEEARARYEEVIAFAGLEAFTEMKLKNYSSGMRVRLAFSLMTQVEADVLLIDEVFAVGDAEFRKKCFQRLDNLRSAGKTIVLVTHAMDALEKQCDRAILLERGRIVLEGDPAEVVEHYRAHSAPMS
jgi:ABC-type polysaccharide/polyol phosphate transport system ATPase subunit